MRFLGIYFYKKLRKSLFSFQMQSLLILCFYVDSFMEYGWNLFLFFFFFHLIQRNKSLSRFFSHIPLLISPYLFFCKALPFFSLYSERVPGFQVDCPLPFVQVDVFVSQSLFSEIYILQPKLRAPVYARWDKWAFFSLLLGFDIPLFLIYIYNY